MGKAGSSQLRVAVKKTGAEACALVLAGTLDLDTYEQLEHAFAGAVADGCIHLTVDLRGIEFLASAGFGVFIEALGTVQELGGSLRFVNPSDKARDVFELLGILMDSCEFE